MKKNDRPLSPHLQIYKPQLSSVLSITHRGTGIFLSLGAFLLTCWLLALAGGAEYFDTIQQYIGSWYGQCLIYIFIFSIYFHLFNGIRHLFWDIGMGFEIDTAYKTGYVVIVATVLMTLITFCLAAGDTS